MSIMSRKVYRMLDGQLAEYTKEPSVDPKAPFSPIQDTMDAIKHPVTEEFVDSKSKYRKINKSLGLEVVGNDLLSAKPHNPKDRITDAVIMDKIERAEAIVNDPSKFRAFKEQEQRRLYEVVERTKDFKWA